MKRILWIILIICFLTSCDKYYPREAPFSDFQQVGFFGHGAGLLGELRLNFWGVTRPCDSCHAVSPLIHADLGTCNSCHQPHQLGWSKSKVAIYHNETLPLAGRFYHFKVDCQECHSHLTSRVKYKQVQCITCHGHNSHDVELAHQWLDEFDLKNDYVDQRCVSCHSKTGKDYSKYYDPQTNDLL